MQVLRLLLVIFLPAVLRTSSCCWERRVLTFESVSSISEGWRVPSTTPNNQTFEGARWQPRGWAANGRAKKKKKKCRLFFSLWLVCVLSGENTFEQVVSVSVFGCWGVIQSYVLNHSRAQEVLISLKKKNEVATLRWKRKLFKKKKDSDCWEQQSSVPTGHSSTGGPTNQWQARQGLIKIPNNQTWAKSGTFNVWTSQPCSSFFFSNQLQSDTLSNQHQRWTV